MTATVRDNEFITVWRSKQLQYIGIPKSLVTCAPELGLSVDDVLLYCLLRARTDYSIKNGWIDDEGRAYIIYTRESAERYLSISHAKMTDCFRKLAKSGLIVEVEQRGKNNMIKAKKIYVKKWITPSNYVYTDSLSVQDIIDGHLPFVKKANIGEYPENFYSMPRLIMEHPIYRDLPLKAKLLYTIALDALHKSILYGDNIDKDGLPYCSLSSSEGEAVLQCSRRTMTTLYTALEDIGLIHRIRSGYGTDWRIYLRDFVPKCLDIDVQKSTQYSENYEQSIVNCSDEQNSDNRCANFEQRMSKNKTTNAQALNNERATFKPCDAQNLNASEHQNQKKESEYFSSVRIAGAASDSLYGSSSDAFQNKIDLNALESSLVGNLFNAYGKDPQSYYRATTLTSITMDILKKDIQTSKTYIRFGNETYSKEQVLREYERLTPEILQALFSKILDRWDDIRKLPDYLHRTLFTAAIDHEGESYYIGLENKERGSFA